MERLHKYMAQCGVASRRKCEEIIAQGRVRVNGEIVREQGIKIDPQIDRVEVDGRPVNEERKRVYVMLNKPVGYVSTADDQYGRPTVLDLVKGVEERIYPVGRLDYDTGGLIILTNDGEFTHRMTHPSHQIDKVYLALVMGLPGEEDLDRLRRGIPVEDYITSPANVVLMEKRQNQALIRITIHEGRNRQVRKMCEAIGCPVLKLDRVAIGSLKLGKLGRGKWRYLTEEEIKKLCH